MDGVADRMPGGFEIDDGTAADAARDLVADAEDARRRLDPRDEAADFCRADVERGNQAAARARQGRRRMRGMAVGLHPRTLAHADFPAPCDFLVGGAGGALTRSTSRSGSRRSTVCTSRFNKRLVR